MERHKAHTKPDIGTMAKGQRKLAKKRNGKNNTGSASFNGDNSSGKRPSRKRQMTKVLANVDNELRVAIEAGKI